MRRLAILTLLILGCSSPSKDSFRMLVGSVIDSATGEVVTGWEITVDQYLGGYSGPDLGEHFCQPHDDPDGNFRIVVAPPGMTGRGPYERLGVKIVSTRSGRPYYRARFYVSYDMWQAGTWKDLDCVTWWAQDESGRPDFISPPQYRLRLRDAP